MDPAITGLDVAKAGVILANMIEAYLAGGAPPSNPEGAAHDDLQDCRSTSVAGSLHLHSSVDDGAGPLQPGEHRTPVQSGGQSAVSGLEPGADSNPRPGSRPIRRANDRSRGLQGVGQRRGAGPSRSDLLPGSLATGAIEPGLASLLELCAISGTLVIDEDGCYDPAEFNDGLVLGMKGTFAQAELHIIRARLHGGKINKAHKGELHFALPVGFVFDNDKTEGAVRTIF